ncbi:MAG: hypothetical protein FWG45_02735 [Oscillospiraceae bacterium]|nr:hypothetical protein [Oscillospiraceae bacterium]
MREFEPTRIQSEQLAEGLQKAAKMRFTFFGAMSIFVGAVTVVLVIAALFTADRTNIDDFAFNLILVTSGFAPMPVVLFGVALIAYGAYSKSKNYENFKYFLCEVVKKEQSGSGGSKTVYQLVYNDTQGNGTRVRVASDVY